MKLIANICNSDRSLRHCITIDIITIYFDNVGSDFFFLINVNYRGRSCTYCICRLNYRPWFRSWWQYQASCILQWNIWPQANRRWVLLMVTMKLECLFYYIVKSLNLIIHRRIPSKSSVVRRPCSWHITTEKVHLHYVIIDLGVGV